MMQAQRILLLYFISLVSVSLNTLFVQRPFAELTAEEEPLCAHQNQHKIPERYPPEFSCD